MDEQVEVNESQLEELIRLNPDGLELTYSTIGTAAGEIAERHVSVSLRAFNVAGLRNGAFDYADRFAKGEEV